MSVQLIETPGSVRVHVPLNLKRRSGRKQVVLPGGIESININEIPSPVIIYRDPIIIAIARAFRWKKLLDEGKYGSIAEMAEDLGINRWYMSGILRLTLLAPDIVEAIVNGDAPDGMSLGKLRKKMPMVWDEQKRILECLLPYTENR